MQTPKLCLTVLAATALAGCGSSRDASNHNFAKAINKAFAAHCVAVNPTSNPTARAQGFPQTIYLLQANKTVTADGAKRFNDSMTGPFEALVKADLLKSESGEAPLNSADDDSKSVPTITYKLSGDGKDALQQPHSTSFCAAHYEVDDMTSFTNPAPNAAGQTSSTASFTFSPDDVADWASSDPINQAYPSLPGRLAKHQQGTAQMTLTNDGWQAVITSPAQ